MDTGKKWKSRVADIKGAKNKGKPLEMDTTNMVK